MHCARLNVLVCIAVVVSAVQVLLGVDLGTVRMHAPSAMAYRIGGRATSLDAKVGFDKDVMGSPGPWGESRRNKAKMAFRVYADGRLVAETKMMTPRDDAVAVHADLKGADVVVIESVDGGYWLGAPYLKAEWGNLTLSVEDGGKVEKIKSEEFAPQFGILTPGEDAMPRFNGPDVFGVSPGKPIFYRIPVTGKKPLRVSVEGLPDGAKFDPERRILSGCVNEPGDYVLNLIAENATGRTTRRFTLAVGGRLAVAPPMGWTSWNALRCDITDANIRETARLLDSLGLADYGWSFVNLDDGWQRRPMKGRWSDPPGKDAYMYDIPPAFLQPPRDAEGRIRPNANFPDMKSLADYVHSIGLKIGLYSSPGPMTCQKFEGSFEHEAQDARTWCDWGFDFIKYDYCTYTRVFLSETKGVGREATEEDHAKPFAKLGAALKALPRDIVFSANASWHGAHRWGEGANINMWRTWEDLKDNWGGLVNAANTAFELAQHSKPGFWCDPDMLVVGFMDTGVGAPHMTKLTPNEQYTHMTLWCLFNAPLLLGCQLDKMDDFTMNLVSNPEVLAVDQDIAHPGARRTTATDSEWVAVKRLSDGSFAVGVVNLYPFKRSIILDFAANGLPCKSRVRDLWRRKDIGEATDSMTFDLPPHAPAFLKISAVPAPEAFDVIECSESTGMFPFHVPERGAGGAADASFMLEAPAGKYGFVRAEGARFVTDAGPIRFNGTNLTGPANFPDRDAADKLASRFAALGINCVRLHYMDTWYSNFMDERRQCLLADDSETQRSLSPEQFDKLDYLVAALKKKGIYVNMNLHVGRRIDERDGGVNGGLTKTVGHFMPRLVELHREYAHDLLTHVNPYTGNAYVDEPAVAMIEISNEDKGLVYAYREGKIEKWPQPFQDELSRQWKAWQAKNSGRGYEAFLWDTERAFWKGMQDYIRNTLKARQVVSGTQNTIKYSPREIQGELDYVDTHAYFNHPKGPGNRGWVDKADGRDWTAGGESHVHAMETLATLENESHVKCKPFTVSEYSNPYPSPFTAEGHPLACAYGATKGWDGVFQYSYNHYPECFGTDEMPWCVFDMVANPAVLVHFPACAAMMVRGDVSEDAEGRLGEVMWNRERPGREYYAVNARNVKMLAGYPDGRTVSLGGVSLAVGDTMTRAAVVSLFSREATGFGEAGKARILIAASATAGNTGSKVERVAPDQVRLVSRGCAPVLVEGVPLDVTFPALPGRVKCWGLAPDGSRKCEIAAEVAADGSGARLRLSQTCRTLWYEVEID